MGWRRDAEGTSKGRRVPLTRRDDLHDAEGTSKGLSLDAKGCPFRRRDCPFTRRDAPKGCPFTSKGFVRSFVSGPSRPDTHPQAPKRRAWEALTQTQRRHTLADAGVLMPAGVAQPGPRKCIEVGPLQPWPGPSPCARLHPRMRPSHPLRGAPPAHSTITLSCTLLRLSLRRCPC